MLARITISMNATQRERDRAGETGRAESLPDGDGELLQGKTIDFGFTLRVPCVRRQSHRIRMQPWEEEERVCVVAEADRGETHCERGWMGVGVPAGNEQRPENAASFFRVSRGSWRTKRNKGYPSCFGSMSSARLETE